MATDGRASDPGNELDPPPIRSPRLELISMSVAFMQALAQRDLRRADQAIGARVPAWLPEQLDHFVQYRLAQLEVDPSVREWLGRAMILTDAAGRRRVVGTEAAITNATPVAASVTTRTVG